MTTKLGRILARDGRFRPVELSIKSLDDKSVTKLVNFLGYQFSSSIVVPVDSFSFTFSSVDPSPFTDRFAEGDIVSLEADLVQVATGIIDQIEITVDAESGEMVTVNGRDLMSQLEDNNAVTETKRPQWGSNMTLKAVTSDLIDGTRIQDVELIDAPTISTLFATEPGESRLSALMRFMEPLNIVAWTSPDGKLVVGKPAFDSPILGELIINKTRRISNVLSMRATMSATSIPNKMIVLWSSVQNTKIGLDGNQVYKNNADGPARLLSKNHNVIKTVMTSIPTGADAQSLSAAAFFQTANAAGKTVLQAQAKREFARANFNELLVQCVVPGHYNDAGDPYMPNTMYHVTFDRASIDKPMYLYAVDWHLSQERGQWTVLSLCNANTIVSDTKVPSSRSG